MYHLHYEVTVMQAHKPSDPVPPVNDPPLEQPGAPPTQPPLPVPPVNDPPLEQPGDPKPMPIDKA